MICTRSTARSISKTYCNWTPLLRARRTSTPGRRASPTSSSARSSGSSSAHPPPRCSSAGRTLLPSSGSALWRAGMSRACLLRLRVRPRASLFMSTSKRLAQAGSPRCSTVTWPTSMRTQLWTVYTRSFLEAWLSTRVFHQPLTSP